MKATRNPPEFGYLRAADSRDGYAVYFGGVLQGYLKLPGDVDDWLDAEIIRVYGPGSRHRFLLRNNHRRLRDLISHQNWRARFHGYPGRLHVDEWIDMLCYFGGTCLRCDNGTKIPVLDHVVPLSRGGSNSIANAQPLCLPCNSRKKDGYVDYRAPDALALFLDRYGY